LAFEQNNRRGGGIMTFLSLMIGFVAGCAIGSERL